MDKGFVDKGGSIDKIFLGEEDEGGVIGIKGIFVVSQGVCLSLFGIFC